MRARQVIETLLSFCRNEVFSGFQAKTKLSTICEVCSQKTTYSPGEFSASSATRFFAVSMSRTASSQIGAPTESFFSMS